MKLKHRNILLAVMLALTVFCGLLIPRINICSDMSEFLPEQSRMKTGLDTLKANFPYISTNPPTIRLMFSGLENSDEISDTLGKEGGVARIMSVRQKDSLTLFEIIASDPENLDEQAESLRNRYDKCIVAETNEVANMPKNMGLILGLAAALIFVILMVMSSSVLEALLFIVTIGLAVVMNIGTNALLPKVSMITTSIVGVLQFVLSMDYSIILMNRYRQEKKIESNSVTAMNNAIRKASTAILSSSLTTIVGLLVLVFMKFKIGMDLGIVLSKGVFFSLISIYTILPALILDFEKGIEKTTKKVLLIPTEALSRFEVKFRWALAPLLLIIFLGSWKLSQKTELSYASIFESEISKYFEPQTSFMLMFEDKDEDALIAFCDSISKDPKVRSAMSYHSVMRRRMTVSQMISQLGELGTLLPANASVPVDGELLNENTLRILFYAVSHPQRDEKMSFDDMMSLASEARKDGIMPQELDVESLMKDFNSGMLEMFEEEQTPEDNMEPGAVLNPAPDVTVSETAGTPADSLDIRQPKPLEPEENIRQETAGSSRFTYENCNAQMDSDELARFMDSGESNTRIMFRMAGRKGKTMSPSEFVHFACEQIQKNAVMKRVVTKEQREGLEEARRQIDSAILAGPSVKNIAVAEQLPQKQDTVETADQVAIPAEDIVSEEKPLTPVPEVKKVKDSPMDRLTEMALSGKKYSLSVMSAAIRKAGIDIDPNYLELMYLYYGSKTQFDDSTALNPEELVDFLCDHVACDPLYGAFIDEDSRNALSGVRGLIEDNLGVLKGDRYSLAAIMTSYPVEDEETFNFVGNVLETLDRTFTGENFFIGEPVMYKEMKDGFKAELLQLTLMTIIAIFLIVAISFRSVLIPVILIMAVMTGVFINVFVSGLGGHKMLYLAYLIVQSILMGATIDYGILITNFYLEFRRAGQDKLEAVRNSYRSSIHTVMTSGIIMVFAPYALGLAMTDPTICSILSSITSGALAAILVIILLLPATLVICDRLIVRKKKE